MAWDLNRIKREVRLIVGLGADAYSDAELEEVIQDYWQVTLPAVLKTESQNTIYRFITRRGLATYPMPEDFVTLSPLAFIDDARLDVTYDSSLLPLEGGYWHTQFISLGDDTQDIFVVTLDEYPDPQSLCVFTNSEVFYWGDPKVKYAYESKTLTVDLERPLARGDSIQVKYRGTKLSTPQWLLIKDRFLTLVPTPSSTWMVEVSGRKRPDRLPSTGDISGVPSEHLDLTVYGSALKILSLVNISDYERIYPVYKRCESVAMAKTYEQLLHTEVLGI